MRNCRSCIQWLAQCRETAQKAICNETGNVTTATQSCSDFVTTEHLYDDFAERLAEGWLPGPSWLVKESIWK